MEYKTKFWTVSECTIIDPTKNPGEYTPIKMVLRDFKGPQKKWKYAITKGPHVWTTKMEWEYEPLPSSRTAGWLQTARFTYEQAMSILNSKMMEEEE